jgi:hypothetical protein
MNFEGNYRLIQLTYSTVIMLKGHNTKSVMIKLLLLASKHGRAPRTILHTLSIQGMHSNVKNTR